MKKSRVNFVLLLITAVFGAVFGIITNIFIDELTAAIWTPLAVALLFFVFALILYIIITFFSRDSRRDNDSKVIIRDTLIVALAFFLSTMLFEFLYELEPSKEETKAESYIILMDDSGSMLESDPANMRGATVRKLIGSKSDNFSYAVYTFANDVKKCRDMLPKNQGSDGLMLNSEGGTALFTALKQVLSDIDSGALKLTSATKILLLSDGYAGDTPFFKGALLKRFVKKHITVSTIGLGGGVDENMMKQIAEYTGGVYVHADNAGMLESAMNEAASGTSTRHLLSYRGFCSANVLHAIMRTVFLLIIIALLCMLKFYAHGSIYKPNLIIFIIAGIIAMLLPEIGLESINLDDGFVRVVFWTLLALAVSETRIRTYGRPVSGQDISVSGGDTGFSPLNGSNYLDKNKNDKDKYGGTSSLM